MARGNDGNLLQHCVDAQLMAELASKGQPIWITFTHAMAPAEPLASRLKRQEQCGLLARALARAAGAEQVGEPAVVGAYRRTRANVSAYPNSAEIAAALRGRDRLRGILFEWNREHFEPLSAKWGGTHVQVRGKSWRTLLPEDLAGLDMPWLVSMDPFSWRCDGRQQDDGHLREPDLEQMGSIVGPLLRARAPGAFVALCYGMDLEVARSFRNTVGEMRDRIGGAVMLECVEAMDCGPDRSHVGAILTNTCTMLEAVRQAWDALTAQTK
jgi:hypothetical protein